VGVVLYFTAQQVAFRNGIIVPKEAQPVYDYIASCVNSIAEEGITLQGMQGGFLNLPSDIVRTPTAYVPMDERNVLKVPLWYYEGESRIPSLALMESDLTKYLEDNLPSCIDHFSAFKDQYPVEEHANATAHVTIGDGAVTVRLEYPVSVVKQDKTVEVPNVVSDVKVDLKRAYELATKTMEREDRDAWFENLTLDFMTADPAIPFDALEFDCSPKSWRLTDIKAELQEVLRFNLPLVRVVNTQTAPFQERESNYKTVQNFKLADFFQNRLPSHVPDDQFEYGRMRFDAGIPKSNVAAAFLYNPRWGLDINGQPNRGGVLSSKITKGAAKYLSFLCTNFYHFTYDVIYPVVMTIHDEDAFLGKGFTFQFAFPVIINSNEGARKNFGYRQFTGFEQATGFCEDLGDQTLEVRASGLDPDIGVVELPDVTLDYECVNQLCTLGTTQAEDGYYRWTGRLPEGCSNPFIVAHKDGYLPTRVAAQRELVELTMPRLREMHIQVVKHPYDLSTHQFLSEQPLSLGENVTIAVSVVNGTFDQFITYPQGNNTLQLIDGTTAYDFNAVLMLFGDLVGGYENAALKVTGRELDGTDTITIHVFEAAPQKQTDEYRAAVAQFLQEGNYQTTLRPVFS
ncbi:MAG TPA: hypothetical protein VLJ21_00360, partial [Candidatus Binatia bacterium]|nr:hypothetical protein [Candidatus Binatia bacterium]